MRFDRRLLVVFLVLASAALADARCHPDAEPDRSDIAAARAAAATHCPCAKLPGGYATCVGKQAKLVLKNKSCAAFVKGCAAHSTCGRPGAVTCCLRTRKGGARCEIKGSAVKCTPPKGGTACVGSAASCCDACAEGTCAPSTTTSTSVTSTTEPAGPTTTQPSVPTTTSTLPLPTCSTKGAACGTSCVPNGNCFNACSHGCALVCVVQYNPLTACSQDSDCPAGAGAVCVSQPTQSCPEGCTTSGISAMCAVPCR